MRRITKPSKSLRSMVVIATLGLGMMACDAPTGRPHVPQARSLSEHDLEIDGDLVVGANGQVTLDEDTRAFFDHFIAAEGEVSEAELHAMVRAEIEQRLDGPAVESAWDLFLAYLDYRREAAALLQLEGVSADELVERLAEIRARTIGAASGVPDEGPRLEAAVEMRSVFNDSTLTTREKAKKTAEIQLRLGDAQGPDAPSRILQRIHAALDEVPRDDVATRRAVLVELVGDEAAERWLSLERSRIDSLAQG